MSTDAAFREVAELLYGGGADELIRKMNPDGADISTKGKGKGPASWDDRKKRQVTAGLSAVGAAAGAAGLTLGGHNVRRSYQAARYGMKGSKKVRAAAGKVKPLTSKKEALKTAIGQEKLATGLVPLEVAGLTGEIAATHILHGDTKRKKPVRKNLLEIPENASFPTNKRELTQAAIPPATRAAGKGAQYTKKKLKRLPDKVETTNVKKRRPPKPGSLRAIKQDVADTAVNLKNATGKFEDAGVAAEKYADEAAKTSRTSRKVLVGVGAAGATGAAAGGYAGGKKARKSFKKSADLDLRWEGEISKVDVDKQQVFGWASIVEMNGEPVVDLQGDYITIDEVEKSAYDYVHKSRKGGDMHLRDNFGGPVSKSHMIESFVVTPEKKQSLGLPESTPTGWWVGYQVNDPELWAKVKNGERTGFSIHGRGVRE